MGKKVLNYGEAVNELQGILEGLESESIDVDEVSIKVKRAVELIKVCKDKILKTETEVKDIVKDFEKEV